MPSLHFPRLHTPPSRLAWLLFWLALGMALLVKVGLVLLPERDRFHPAEVDDSYAYLHVTARLAHCVVADCPALEDIHRHTRVPAADPTVAREQWDLASRTMLVHSPLLAGWVGVGGWLGVTPEYALRAFWAVGAALVMGGLAYWLLGVAGPAPAALALLLLTFLRLPDHGLNWFTPGTVSLGVLAWYGGHTLRRPAPSLGGLLAVMLLLATLHQMGKVYAGVAIAAFALAQPRPWGRPWLRALAVAGGLLAALFLLPPLLPLGRNTLSVPPPDLFLPATLPAILSQNAQALLAILRQLVAGVGRWELLLLPLLLGLWGAARRPALLATTVLWSLLLIASLLHYHPFHPATLAERLMVGWSASLAAALGVGFTLLVTWAANWAAQAWSQRALRPLAALLVTAPLLVLAGNGVRHLLHYGLADTLVLNERKAHHHDFRYAPQQLPRLLAGSCQRIAYDDMATLLYALTHGGLQCGALYLPGVEQGRQLLEPDWRPSHFALRNVGHDQRGRLTASAAGPLPLQLPASARPTAVAVRLEADALGSRLRLSQGQRLLAEQTVTRTGWLVLGEIPAGVQGVELAPAGGQVRLAGVRLGNGQPHNWPWDQGVSIGQWRFDSGALLPERNFKVEIWDDDGSLVVGRLLGRE